MALTGLRERPGRAAWRSRPMRCTSGSTSVSGIPVSLPATPQVPPRVCAGTSRSMPALTLGPLLRYVGETCAAFWVETDGPCDVTVRVEESSETERTFHVEGHHYGLVQVEDLEPGEYHSYEVELDGETVWPEPDSAFPPSRFRTYPKAKPLEIAFGSCRVAVPNEEPYTLNKSDDDRGRELDALVVALVQRVGLLVGHGHATRAEGDLQRLGLRVGAEAAGREGRVGLGPHRLTVELHLVGVVLAGLEILHLYQAVVVALDVEGALGLGALLHAHGHVAGTVGLHPEGGARLPHVAQERTKGESGHGAARTRADAGRNLGRRR